MLILPIKKEMVRHDKKWRKKKEEYREIKPYWSKRFWNAGLSIWDPDVIRTLTFRNGYSKSSPKITAKSNMVKRTR